MKHNSILKFVLFYFINLSAIVAFSQSKKIEILKNNAVEKINLMDYNGAILLLNKIIEKDDLNTEALFLRGICFDSLKKYSEAMIDYNKVVSFSSNIKVYKNRAVLRQKTNDYSFNERMDKSIFDLEKYLSQIKDDFEAYSMIGELQFSKNNIVKSKQNLEISIRLKPNYYRSHFFLGLILLEKNKEYNSAIEEFSKVISINPKYSDAYLYRAKASKELGIVDDFYKDLELSIQMDSLNWSSHIELGLYFAKSNQFNAAITHFSKTIEILPNLKESYLFRAKVFLQIDENNKCINDLDQFILMSGGNEEAFFYRGVAKLKIKDLNGAIIDFDKTLEINPYNIMALNNRGILRKDLDKYELAIADFNKIIKLDSTFYDAYYNLGIVKFKLKAFDESINAFTKSIELKNDYYQAYCYRGDAKFAKGLINEAIDDYTKSIKINKDFALAYNSRGVSYKKLGKINEAFVDYNLAIELDSSYAGAYTNRGNLYRLQNNTQLALKDYNSAILLDNKSIESYFNRATLYLKIGDINLGCGDLKKASELNPMNNEVKNMIIEHCN
jgi:tetratricopeptide (TPR) repeat protein